MNKWLQKINLKHQQKQIRTALRESYVYRILGERIFDKRIWKLEINSLAGGLSLGLFVALTPTIPFQMFLSALGAVLMRVNLPIALLACWITNPVTALPIYLAARTLGRYLLEDCVMMKFVLDLFCFESRTGKFMEHGIYLWAGSFMFAFCAAVMGNVGIRLAWYVRQRLKNPGHKNGSS
ncbi:MAG: DUF2062 domain-containing protein [Desulfamplus sp.]|nr:DUF2062 domain-containing protein [Desulfamplus sp.]